jgi:hypothetical protein
MAYITTGNKLAIISPQAYNPYQRRLVQVTSGISSGVCLQTLTSTDTQSWVGDKGLIMVHEKYFLLITFQHGK